MSKMNIADDDILENVNGMEPREMDERLYHNQVNFFFVDRELSKCRCTLKSKRINLQLLTNQLDNNLTNYSDIYIHFSLG